MSEPGLLVGRKTRQPTASVNLAKNQSRQRRQFRQLDPTLSVPQSFAPPERIQHHLNTRRSRKKSQLLDHLLGACEQRRWNFEAERLCGLEVDHELESCGLHNRDIGGLGAL